MPKEARKKAEGELKKLKLMSPMSAEATVVRNYIDTLVNLPWSKKTKIKHDLSNAENVLDEDHYGLEKVKDRILEYLAVQQRVDKVKAPILCLVGPPGRRQDLARPERGARHRPQVRPHGARRHARRGRDPRPPPHLHRLDAGQGAAEPDARSARATRCSCSTRSTSSAWTSAATRRRRCSRCSTRSRTTPSATTTSRSTSTCAT